MITNKYLAKLCKKANAEKTFSAKNIQGLVVEYPKVANIVAFRGTEFKCTPEGFKDLFTNFLAIPQYTDDCGKVHRGAYNAAKAAIGEVEKRVTKDLPLYLVGHSLGGAIALLLAPIFIKKGYKVIVVTFGAPKVTYNDTTTLAMYNQLSVTQFINRKDVVPSRFFTWPWTYTHINRTHVGTIGNKSWQDHTIDSYIELL